MQRFSRWNALQTDYRVPQHTPECAPVFAIEPQSSSIFSSLELCFEQLKTFAQQANMTLGITDQHGTLLRTWSSHHMQSAAEQVHFIEGGHWSTQAVGSNAIGLALNSRHAKCVHSHENSMNSVRDWVCYAAPILDPLSGHLHGIVNLSTKSSQHNTLGVFAASHCAQLFSEALRYQQHLQLYTLGQAQVVFNQQRLALSFRQIEILAILALHPQGINLEQLHYALYGERDVSLNTLKAEISTLRRHLPDCLENRTYRLSCHIECDFLQAEYALQQGLIASSFNLYRGTFLAKTESPTLIAWRHCFDAKLSQFIDQMHDLDALLDLFSRVPERLDVLQRIVDLLPPEHHLYPYMQSLLES